MDGKSINPQEELLELLRQKFPEVFAEGKVDFQKLKQTLGEEVNLDTERYGITWAGKSNCFRVLQEPTTATLKPSKDESVGFDETENLFIEGDNLEVLKILQKSYYGKVKMIYIDVPYNTGNDFIYNDDFKQDKEEYQQEAGIKDDNGNLRSDGLIKNTKDRGHYHSDWLNMMYPRLFLARNLLRQEGVIFVSIDDNEVYNLKLIMDEIFGEENFVGQLAVQLNPRGRNLDKFIAKTHESILIFTKDYNNNQSMFGIKKTGDMLKEYDKEDSHGKYRLTGLRNRNQLFNPRTRPKLFYPLYVDPKTYKVSAQKDKVFSEETYPITSEGVETCWTWGKEKVENESSLLIAESFGDGWRVYRKDYLIDKDGNSSTTLIKSLWTDKEINNDYGKKSIKELFGSSIMSFPKSPYLIVKLLQASTTKSDIVMDFFAGSGTTAHAVMQLNAEDGESRKCISVQLPELCDEKSEAYKAGYKTIADIAKERIKRAGKKIKDDKGNQLDIDSNKLDTGFKVFKLDQSNFKIWRTDVKNDKELMEQMNIFIDNVKAESTQDNIMYELILKSGLDLNVAVEKKKADKKTYYSVDNGRLIICLEDKLSQGLVDAILADKPEKVICLDKAFGGNDQLKTNTVLQMEAGKIDFKII